MKKVFTLLFFVLLFQSAFSQTWHPIPNMIGEVRGRSGTFSIGDTGYIIAGGHFWYLPSSYGYDTLSQSWFQIADYPGYDDDPICASINGKGYCVTGGSCCPAYSNSLYEYDPSTNSWNSSLPPLPGPQRTFAVGFAVSGKLYVGGGVNNTGTPSNSNPLADFYSYDPSTNTWDTIAPCPAAGVSAFPVGFAINGKGYVGTGGKVRKGDGNDNYIPQTDFWEYDPSNNTWTRKADFGGGPRCGGVGWATCDKGYIGSGYTDSLGNDYTNDFWQYDPINDAWTQIANYTGIPRKFANVFVVGNSGFVGDGSTPTDTSDFYEFHQVYTPAFTTANSTHDSICQGGSIAYSDQSNYTPTNWYWHFPGGNPDTSTQQNPTVQYDTAGTFDVTFSAWNGCDSAGQTFTAYVTVTQSVTIDVEPQSPVICNGQFVSLYVVGGGANFTWSPATGLNSSTGDTVLASPTTNVTYTVTGSNSGGCSGTGSDDISVVPAPNKPTISVSASGDTLVSSATQGNQWFKNDTIINGATTDSLNITGLPSASYTVEVINPANGCTATSDSLVASSINQLAAISNQLSIYPNPTSGTIFITINSSAQNLKDWSLEVSDVLGRILFTKSSLSYSNELELPSADGVYFITVVNKTGRAVLPVVKE